MAMARAMALAIARFEDVAPVAGLGDARFDDVAPVTYNKYCFSLHFK